MNFAWRQLLVIALSFAVVFGSGLFTYAAWVALGAVDAFARGTFALLLWVGIFYVGAILFWKAMTRLPSA